MSVRPGAVDRRLFLVGAGAVLGAVGCAPAPATVAPDDSPALRVTDTDWTTLPAGPVPPTDVHGRSYVQTVVPRGVGAAVIGGPGGPGLHGSLPDGRSASYVVQNLDRPPVELGAVVAFGPGNGLGSFCLARFDRWTDDVGSRGDVRSSCHLGVSATRWTYGVFRSPHLQVVHSAEFRTPIPQDGSPHSLRVVVDGPSATVVEPDGDVVRFDDPRLAAAPTETFACWEFFKLGPGADDTTFLRTWAR